MPLATNHEIFTFRLATGNFLPSTRHRSGRFCNGIASSLSHVFNHLTLSDAVRCNGIPAPRRAHNPFISAIYKIASANPANCHAYNPFPFWKFHNTSFAGIALLVLLIGVTRHSSTLSGLERLLSFLESVLTKLPLSISFGIGTYEIWGTPPFGDSSTDCPGPHSPACASLKRRRTQDRYEGFSVSPPISSRVCIIRRMSSREIMPTTDSPEITGI